MRSFGNAQVMSEQHDLSQEDYWRRKQRELQFLERYAEPSSECKPPDDIASFRRSVIALRERILLRLVKQTASLSETSLFQLDRHESPAGPIEYSYQRHDLRRIEVDWLREIHFTDAANRFVDGLYLSCGMAGISAILAVIARRGWTRVQFSAEGYFESFQLVDRFFGQLLCDQAAGIFSSEREVLWLDTCSACWPDFPERRGSLQMIVVDTSCVEPDSEHVTQWLGESQRLQCPLVLVRSHLKLDTFGLELGRLGSVIAVAPANNPEATKQLALELNQARTGMGTGFSLTSLYPWIGDPQLARLARLRTAAIRRATQCLFESLLEERQSGDRFEVLDRVHGIYLVVRTHLNVAIREVCEDDPAAMPQNLLSRTIAQRCQGQELPVIAATSFGLDQIVVLDYVNMHDGRHQLRVSGADLPHYYLPQVAAQIRQVIAEFSISHD
jgi:hypothetical protein